jgi:hypothetical protein
VRNSSIRANFPFSAEWQTMHFFRTSESLSKALAVLTDAANKRTRMIVLTKSLFIFFPEQITGFFRIAMNLQVLR